MPSSPCNMSDRYNYGNDYSYGYGYSSQSQSANNAYEYANNYSSNLKNPTYASPPQSQFSQQQPYNPAAILNNPAAQIGMQFGTQALSAGQEYVNNNVKFI
jgi:hypothetical protein